MNKKFLPIFFLLLTVGFFTGSLSANALVVYSYENFSDLKVGDTSTLKVFFNTEGKEINVLEGKIKIKGPVKISDLNTTGSIFSMWPEKPEISEKQEINFTGGVEGGVYGRDLRLFNFTLTKIAEGKIIIKPIGISAYLNDGKGTALKNKNSNLAIDKTNMNNFIFKILRLILIVIVLITFFNIFRKIFKTKKE
jgi:hypothetical protein